MERPKSETIKILFVDDEPTLLEVTKSFLEGLGGMIIDLASSGEEALKVMEGKKFDAIISDYQMPVMDGISLLKKVRERDKDIPFILFTGKGR
jgi:CheY-like chemotaxis protein